MARGLGGKKEQTNSSLPADSEAKRSLTLSADEYARVRRSAIDSEILGEAVRLFIVEPDTFLLKGDSENSLLRASSVLKALGLGFRGGTLCLSGTRRIRS